MRGSAVISDQSLKVIERAILVVGSITLGVSVFLLISMGYSRFQRTEADAKLALTKQEISTLTTTIQRAKVINRQPTSAKELGIVQVAFNRLAKKNDCQLLELSSNADSVPFLSKYVKGSDDHGWKQIPLDGQVTGSLANVMTLIRDFTSMSIPIEVQSIDILPIANNQVSAKVAFQLLKQEVTR